MCEKSEQEDKESIGVLFCCGKRLEWREVEGSPVVVVECPRCGITYAMDAGEVLDDPNRFCLESLVLVSALVDERSSKARSLDQSSSSGLTG